MSIVDEVMAIKAERDLLFKELRRLALREATRERQWCACCSHSWLKTEPEKHAPWCAIRLKGADA